MTFCEKGVKKFVVCHSSVHILLSFGLHEIPARIPGNRAFTMNVEESGAPVSIQYKEALKEFQEKQITRAKS